MDFYDATLYKKLNKFSYTSISKFTFTNKKANKNLGNLMQDSLVIYYISMFSKTVICVKFNRMFVDMPFNFKIQSCIT
jgi:hypothetical protein